MNAMNETREISFTYDPWRGGFLLKLGLMGQKHRRPLLGGLMSAFLREDGRIQAVESFWDDHGGLPLRGIHESTSCPEGTYAISGDELRVGTILIRQAPDKMAIWFSTGSELPRRHWKVQRDLGSAITVYFSHRKAKAGWPVPGIGGRSEVEMLAGIEIALDRSVAEYPLATVSLKKEDFK